MVAIKPDKIQNNLDAEARKSRKQKRSEASTTNKEHRTATELRGKKRAILSPPSSTSYKLGENRR
jgi:hypothetical protein